MTSRDQFIQISPYKQMPMAFVGDHNGNEFFVLLTHDAIRNFDQKTFFFIDNLSQLFLRNHMFSTPDRDLRRKYIII